MDFKSNRCQCYVSDAESWRPVSGHRVNRYNSKSQVILGAGHPENKALRISTCLRAFRLNRTNSLGNRIRCFRANLGAQESKDNNTSRLETAYALGSKDPLPDRLFYGQNKSGSLKDALKFGASKQRKRRGAVVRPRRPKLGNTVVKVQHQSDEDDAQWLPVSLAPPKGEEDFDTKTNLITQNLVNGFVSNSLPDLKFPQQNSGTIVQIINPLLSQNHGDSKWESVSLDDLIVSHTTEPVHYHKPSTWHKRPTVILVQDAPAELLPKPPNYQTHYEPLPESHRPAPSPEPFPRPTYHYPRPSPEPPPKPSHFYTSAEPSPKPTYHYPVPEPSPEPVHHYHTTTTHKPHYPSHYHQYLDFHYPYTSVTVQTSTPDPDPPWNPQPPEDEDFGPEIIVGSHDPVPEPSPDPPPINDVAEEDVKPSRPTPPSIFVLATPLTPVNPPAGTPLNPVTISSGRPPPSIVILSSPEDAPPAASPPLADPIPAAPAAGGGLVPIVPLVPPIFPPIIPGAPPIVPGLLGAAAGGGGGGNSDCPAVQLFNVQTITNSIENKDCIINLNSPVHNVNGGGQIESPDDVLYDDVPDSSTVATTTKKPSSHSMTVLEYIQDFFTSMTIFNPISMGFWSFLFAPVSILLASGLGVAALVLPWLFPSYWFSRRSNDSRGRVGYDRPYRLSEATLRFERSLKLGMNMDNFLHSIGLL